MPDLITSDVATAALAAGQTALTTAQSAWLPTAITAASDAIVRYCQREFAATDYDEVYVPRAGQWDRGEPDTIILRSLPLNSISRMVGGRTTALTATNTDTATNQRATIAFTFTGDPATALTYTGLNLNLTASGVTTASPLLFADYVTITALADAINNLGNGWTATVTQGYGLYSSSDLHGSPAPVNCLGASQAAPLSIFANDLSNYSPDFRTGTISLYTEYGGNNPSIDNPFFWEGIDTFVTPGSFRSPVRVTYNAGFATIPAAVQQACCEVVKNILERLTTDSTLQSESDGAYSYTSIGPLANDCLTNSAKTLLALYRTYAA